MKDWWITDMDSFHHQKPSLVRIETCSLAEVLIFDHTDYNSLLQNHSVFEAYFRQLFQKAYIREQARIVQMLSFSAKERYNHFNQKYPALVQNIPQKQIASYLGISPEFLSSIRNKS